MISRLLLSCTPLALAVLAAQPLHAQDFTPPPEDAAEVCEQSDALFLAINRERDLLEAQRSEIARDTARLDLLREAVAEETASLTALRDDLGRVLDSIAGAERAEVQKLVAVYETMKPEEAARLLDGLDMSITMILFSAMSERRAAPILARMDSVRAQAISRILIEMAKLPEDRNFDGIRLR